MVKVRLEEMMQKRGMTKYRLGIEMGLDPSQTYRWFSKKYDPKLSLIEKWARVLQCRISDLFDDDDFRDRPKRG